MDIKDNQVVQAVAVIIGLFAAIGYLGSKKEDGKNGEIEMIKVLNETVKNNIDLMNQLQAMQKQMEEMRNAN